MPRFDKPPTDRLMPIKGTPPSLIRVPQGCAFNPRCEYSEKVGSITTTERPELTSTGAGHQVACHMPPEERQRVWAQEISPRLQ
jgi:peptide/nickel transport system ATP-binding protein